MNGAPSFTFKPKLGCENKNKGAFRLKMIKFVTKETYLTIWLNNKHNKTLKTKLLKENGIIVNNSKT